ncbi:MAG: hypothetical protein WEB90_00230 [Gemmatimonadota bacterium]
MPVSSRVRDGVMVLTVDGDYTVNELRRIGFGALEAPSAPRRVPVLLDLSGTAGLAKKSTEDLAATGAIFGAYRDRLSGIAVVAPADVAALFDAQSVFAHEAGVGVMVYQSHADAREWLTQVRGSP